MNGISQNCFAQECVFGMIRMSLTFMKVAVCWFVGTDAHSVSIAQGAARLAFPQAILTTFNTVEEALNCEAVLGGELLVLANVDEISVIKATEARDATGLRRWAIVILGETRALEGVEIVSSQEWDAPPLARVLRSAVVRHQLIRENERFQGDLRTLAYRISHDLRTPLGGILSAAEALKEILADHDPASVALTKPLFDSVADLGKLIDRVSMVTKASANPVAKKSVPMGEVLWAALQRHERQILKKNAVVTQPDSWPEVEAVSSWLEVVWGNLLSNALQHGKTTPRIELGWSQNEQEFRFWVSDNGTGVPSEKLGDLFQPFHLLHHSNARKGLGLSIVQRLLEFQGGRCGYERSSEGGSTFYFTLPAEKRGNGSPLSSAIPVPNPGRETQT